MEGIEYFFGQGVHTCRAGGTHHGKPMEIISLGRTSLPMEVILEYLESLKSIYTAEVSSPLAICGVDRLGLTLRYSRMTCFCIIAITCKFWFKFTHKVVVKAPTDTIC
jgi:hypothetical protein